MNRECIAELSCHSSDGHSWKIQLLMPVERGSSKPWDVEVEESGLCTPMVNHKRTLGAAYCEHLLRQLSQARVPGIFEYVAGCDGAHYELALCQGFNKTVYQWWISLPAGFEPLMHFSNELIKAGCIKDVVTTWDSGN